MGRLSTRNSSSKVSWTSWSLCVNVWSRWGSKFWGRACAVAAVAISRCLISVRVWGHTGHTVDLFVFIEQAISSYTCGMIRVCLWQTANMMTWVLMWYPTCSTYIQRRSPVAFPRASRALSRCKASNAGDFSMRQSCWLDRMRLLESSWLPYMLNVPDITRRKCERQVRVQAEIPKKSMGRFRDFVHH